MAILVAVRRWELSSWLVLVRAFQLVGSLASVILNGFLLLYIYFHRLGFAQMMFSLEMMTCIIFIYTAIVLLVQHTGRRRLLRRARVIIAFIIADVVATGVIIGIITILARSGLPMNCGGLTRTDFAENETPNKPHEGFTTVRFSSGGENEKGELDGFCSLERGYYLLSVAIIFSYMATVTLSVLRICEGLYTRNSRVNEQLTTANELLRLESKVHKAHRYPPSPRLLHPSSPIQEGITSPTRTRSTRTSSRAASRRSTLAVSPSTSPAVTIHPSQERLLAEPSAEHAAEAAMVTDGYRPTHSSMSVLPPYTPGESSRFMTGHAGETNEIRLSEYVKGETRAQDMKSGLGRLG